MSDAKTQASRCSESEWEMDEELMDNALFYLKKSRACLKFLAQRSKPELNNRPYIGLRYILLKAVRDLEHIHQEHLGEQK